MKINDTIAAILVVINQILSFFSNEIQYRNYCEIGIDGEKKCQNVYEQSTELNIYRFVVILITCLISKEIFRLC